MADRDALLNKQQVEVDNKLWSMADELRGNMDASEFKNYILGLIFYKFLSDKIVKTINDELKDENLTYEEAWKDESLRNDIKKLSVNVIGYFLDPQFLFGSFVKKIDKNTFTVEDLKEGIKALVNSTIGFESQDDFSDLFDDMDLDNHKLGKGEGERRKLIGKIISKIDDLNLDISETNFDILGHAYEYLIGKFAASAGKKAGEFYTPAQVSELLARIVTLENKELKTAYDPTCGSGSLLLRVRNNVSNKGSIKLYGQEMVTTTYNLARMNMLLHGVEYEKFDIANDDTLEKPSEKHKNLKFDAVVANPPYSANWEPDGKEEDSRFNGYDGEYAPRAKADYAFVQHMIYHLNDSGTLAVVLPRGALYRSGSEVSIRMKLVKDYNIVDAVIGLPGNLFFGTPIPTCIVVIKKCRKSSDNILFIDASGEFEKGKNQNYLREKDIEKIIDVYKNRSEIDGYSKKASVSDVISNEASLNIAKYVSAIEVEEVESFASLESKRISLQKERDRIDLELQELLKGLKYDE